jgi:hypothetical protein
MSEKRTPKRKHCEEEMPILALPSRVLQYDLDKLLQMKEMLAKQRKALDLQALEMLFWSSADLIDELARVEDNIRDVQMAINQELAKKTQRQIWEDPDFEYTAHESVLGFMEFLRSGQ